MIPTGIGRSEQNNFTALAFAGASLFCEGAFHCDTSAFLRLFVLYQAHPTSPTQKLMYKLRSTAIAPTPALSPGAEVTSTAFASDANSRRYKVLKALVIQTPGETCDSVPRSICNASDFRCARLPSTDMVAIPSETMPGRAFERQ